MNPLQQCAEEFIASCLSESPTGQIRLMESILERNNMKRAVSVQHALLVMLMIVSLYQKQTMREPSDDHLGLCSPGSDSA
jgi:hypothetical protein